MRRLTAALFLLLCWPLGLQAQEGGVRRALLIGVEDYRVNDDAGDGAVGLSYFPDLRGPGNDLRLMERVLTTRLGFDPADIVTLTDAQAGRAAIVAALQQIVADSGPEDAVYVHFSGYGAQVPDLDGDERDGWDETILPYDARTPGVADITDDELDGLLGPLRSRHAVVVLDAGHWPMPVAPGSEIQVRAAGRDDRAELYAPEAAAGLPASAIGGAYALMTAAAPHQFALESRLEGEIWFGWFSWSLAQALAGSEPQASAEVILRRAGAAMSDLGERVGLRSAAPSMDAPDDIAGRPLLGDAAAGFGAAGMSTRVWVDARSADRGQVALEGGALLGGQQGSLWAIFDPETDDFDAGGIRVTAEVIRTDGVDATARLDGGGTVPDGSRAVLLAPPPPPETVPVWLRRVESLDRAALRKALRAGGRAEFVESARGARLIVNLDDRGCRVFGPGGLQQLDRFRPEGVEQAAERLATMIERTARLTHLQSMRNPAGAIGVAIRVSPIDVDGMLRLARVPGARDVPVFRTRVPGEPRAPDNSLMMSVRADRSAYVTVVDIGPQGDVVPLFPNPVSDERGYFPEGRISGGQEVRIPDSLAGGVAGFYIDFEPPLGPDTLRVFAAADLLTAQRIRDYLGRYLLWAESGGDKPDFAELFLPIELPALTGEEGEPPSFGVETSMGRGTTNFLGDWTASSESFRIGP